MKNFVGHIFLALAFFISTVFFSSVEAYEVRGYLNTGIWYVKNDQDSSSTYLADDNYGLSYVQTDFSMFNANLDMDLLNLNRPDATHKTHVHLKGRFLYNLMDNPYSLATPDRYRYQGDELNLQYEYASSDFWFGRHTIYETGGVGVDGVTAIFKMGHENGVGVYGGLGNDPRTLTGYIGPAYENMPFTIDFLTGGAFTKLHYEKFQMDVGINTLLYKRKVDRSNFYTQFFWSATNAWSFSGIADVGFMGDTGLQRMFIGANTKITPKITNRFSFSQFRTLFYKYSNASAIPLPASINPTIPLGTTVDKSSYFSTRDEIQLKFEQNYIFTSIEWARRTFDDRNRFKYSFGYFDPEIFESPYDFRIQADIIDNFVGFNSSLDTTIGRDFANDEFRAEIGGTLYANERNVFINGTQVTALGQVEKESALRANFQWSATHNLTWFLNYAYYSETDVVNQNQKVHTHDIYLSSNVRF